MKLFYDSKIATKLLLSFAAVIALTVLLGVFSITQLAKINQTSDDLASNWMPSVRVLLQMKNNVVIFRLQELRHILSTDDAERADRNKAMLVLLETVQKNGEEYAKLIVEPEEKTLFAQFNQLWAQYQVEHVKIMQLSNAHKPEEANNLIRGLSVRINKQLTDQLEKLTTINVEGGNKSAETGAALYATSRHWIIGTLAACVVLGAALALFVARAISRPLNDALNIAKTVAGGDLTSRIAVTSKDETGQLLQALELMNTGLAAIVGDVRGAADTIATASGQIASGNLDLSSRTEQQASSLEETASAMEELTSTVKQNADNARQANGLAAVASEVALKGGAVVSKVVGTMASINESSKKIADIIGVIDSIAFQTNILALNASVESARAGEHGRGFAVVAAEVRNLAQRSATAAREIKVLIGDSVEKVDIGSRLVDQAGATMDEIVISIKRVSDIMGEITSASQEQSAGIEQVTMSIAEMDRVTQQNASLVEEAAAAAESLQEQAGSLVQMVSKFKLNNGAAVVATHLSRLGQFAKPIPAARHATKAPAKLTIAAKVSRSGSDQDWLTL